MSENTNITIEPQVTDVTAKEIWEQITRLQEQMISVRETLSALIEVDTRDEFDNGNLVRSVNCELVQSQIAAMQTVFCEREKTMNSLLDFYKMMYHDACRAESESKPESDAKIKQRSEFLKFVKDTTVASVGPNLPDFEKIWKTVYLGE